MLCRRSILFTLLIALSTSGRVVADEAEDRVVASVDKRVGQIIRDETKAEKPIVGISLSYSRVMDSWFKKVSALKNLTRLDLTCCQMDDAAWKALAQVTNLTELRLSADSVTDANLSQLLPLVNLGKLDLGLNSEVTDRGMKELAHEEPHGCQPRSHSSHRRGL